MGIDILLVFSIMALSVIGFSSTPEKLAYGALVLRGWLFRPYYALGPYGRWGLIQFGGDMSPFTGIRFRSSVYFLAPVFELTLPKFQITIAIPKWLKFPGDEWKELAGFYFTAQALWFGWGKYHAWYWPWDWTQYRRWERVEEPAFENPDAFFWILLPDNFAHGRIATRKSAPYLYILRSHDVQRTTATVYEEKVEGRRRWLRWCPWFNRINYWLHVEFDTPIGEQTGSWKGGVLGCSWQMQEGELALDALGRMEREREFK